MERIPEKVIHAVFFRLPSGTEPVRDWLWTLDKDSRYAIGKDIRTIELGWPLGMPLVRKLDDALWEVRSHVSGRRIARVLFTVVAKRMVLLHGLIKKSGKIPHPDLELAWNRRDLVLGDYS